MLLLFLAIAKSCFVQPSPWFTKSSGCEYGYFLQYLGIFLSSHKITRDAFWLSNTVGNKKILRIQDFFHEKYERLTTWMQWSRNKWSIVNISTSRFHFVGTWHLTLRMDSTFKKIDISEQLNFCRHFSFSSRNAAENSCLEIWWKIRERVARREKNSTGHYIFKRCLPENRLLKSCPPARHISGHSSEKVQSICQLVRFFIGRIYIRKKNFICQN